MKSNRGIATFCKQKTVKKEIEWLTSFMTIHNHLECQQQFLGAIR
jgi:hypothetical protein